MSSLEVRKSTGSIGAEIHGVDLAKPLDDATQKEIEQALYDHLVVFFRDQEITPAQQKAFGRHFGELDIHPFIPNLGGEHPEVIVLDHDGSGRRGNYTDQWHSDVTFAQEPPLGSILRAVQLPEVGGDTLWANMYDAYDALSSTLQSRLDGLVAVHDFTQTFGKLFGRTPEGLEKLRNVQEQYPPAEHPLVRTHPVTKRMSLYVNRVFTSHLVDMNPKESDNLLSFLYEHCASPDFQVRFRWRENSIAFWDNRAAQHYAVNDYSGRRLMHRITITGDRPF